jgi:hypothetical protein
MSRRPVTDRPRHAALLHSLGSGAPANPQSITPTNTFHILTEGSDVIITEAGDNLDIE